MDVIKPLVRRFAGPVIAAYLLHWGIWTFVFDAVEILMSMLTRILTWLADHSPAGFPRVEREFWFARYLAAQTAWYGLLPIALGLVVGWLIFRGKNRSLGNQVSS